VSIRGLKFPEISTRRLYAKMYLICDIANIGS